VVTDGSEYRGNWVDGYRHGEGTFTYHGVTHAQRASKLEYELRYEGSWRADKREGEGLLYYGGTHGCHVAPPPDDVQWRLLSAHKRSLRSERRTAGGTCAERLVYVGGYRNDNFHGIGFKLDVEGDGFYCGACICT